MKKTLLFISLLVGGVITGIAQTSAPFDIYTDAHNNMALVYNNNYVMVDSDTTVVSGTAQEGTAFLDIDYSVSGYYAGGALAINNYWYYDARDYTHLSFYVMHEADDASIPSIKITMQDTNLVSGTTDPVSGPEITVFTGESTSDYTQVKVALSDFVGTSDLNIGALKYFILVLGDAETATGNIKIDNIQFVDEGNVSIYDEQLAQDISVAPNPSTSGMYIINTDRKIESLTLTDQMGKPIEFENTNTQIDLSNLSDGIYFLRISSEGRYATKKLIKK